MVILTSTDYQDKALGAWLGKLIGCAAGTPTNGDPRPHEITDYPAALPAVSPLACEGLLFARLWLEELRANGVDITGEDLVRAWLERVPRMDLEYGYAHANFRLDLLPPVSGVYNNPYRESLGALARADLWGMLAPGDPATAAHYALQDASLDHAGAGVEAAILLAGLVSAAFAESDPARLVEVALRLIPRESRVARAVRDVARWHGELANWRRTREMLLRSYGSEDLRDATVSAGLIALSLLDGEGDFGHTVTTAAKCGWSAACTGAAAGAVLGAALGAAALPASWRAVAGPAGEAAALAALTGQVGRVLVAQQSDGRARVSDEVEEPETRLVVPDVSALLQALAMGPYVVPTRQGPLEVLVDYETRPTIGYDLPRRLSFAIANHSERDLELRVRLSAPEGFIAVAGAEPLTLPEESVVTFSASVTAPEENCRIAPVNECLLRIAVEDEPELSVPITLVGESTWYAAGPYGDFNAAHAPETPEVLGRPEPEAETPPDLASAAPPPPEAPPAEPEAAPAMQWRRLSVAEPAVNVLAGMEGEQGTYYLATDFPLEVENGQPARLRVACNDGVIAWLNGRQVLSHHQHRPADPRVSADECDVDLRAGRNRLVVKLAQCSPRRMLAVVLLDREGRLLIGGAGAEEGRADSQ